MQASLNDSQSIYMQIAALIEDNILKDILLEEEQAPSQNELARLYGINPATAAKGLNLLVDEGILYKKRGLGMFVAQGAKRAVQQKHRASLYQSFVLPLAEEMKKLGLSAAEVTEMLTKALDAVD